MTETLLLPRAPFRLNTCVGLHLKGDLHLLPYYGSDPTEYQNISSPLVASAAFALDPEPEALCFCVARFLRHRLLS